MPLRWFTIKGRMCHLWSKINKGCDISAHHCWKKRQQYKENMFKNWTHAGIESVFLHYWSLTFKPILIWHNNILEGRQIVLLWLYKRNNPHCTLWKAVCTAVEPLQRNRVRSKKQTRAEEEQPQEQSVSKRSKSVLLKIMKLHKKLNLLAVLCNVYLQHV